MMNDETRDALETARKVIAERLLAAGYYEKYDNALAKIDAALAADAQEALLLLLCPFCGDDHAIFEENHLGVQVLCEGCGALTGYAESEHEAARNWNRRAALFPQGYITRKEGDKP